MIAQCEKLDQCLTMSDQNVTVTEMQPEPLIWNLFDSVLSDLDGVVYEGSNAIEPAPSVLNKLAALDIPVAYVTNNSSRRSEVIAEQLLGLVKMVKQDLQGSKSSALTQHGQDACFFIFSSAE